MTGAGGFIGGVVARALAVAGHRVSALHRGPVPTSLVAAGVTAIQGDLRDPTRFPERYDALIHAGAVIPARNIAGNDFAAVNIAATEALLAQTGGRRPAGDFLFLDVGLWSGDRAGGGGRHAAV